SVLSLHGRPQSSRRIAVIKRKTLRSSRSTASIASCDSTFAKPPLTWGYFPITGAPYRAYLFRVGRRTQYWVIYTVDEQAQTVDVLQFWNATRDPESLEL